MQFRFRCAAVLTAVLLCSAAAMPVLAEDISTPETAAAAEFAAPKPTATPKPTTAPGYTGWKTENGKDYWYKNGVSRAPPAAARRSMTLTPTRGTGWMPNRAVQRLSARMSIWNPTAANGCAMTKTATW